MEQAQAKDLHAKLLSVQIEQLNFPSDILDETALRLLGFLANELFSERFLRGIATGYLIHLVRKPRSKKEVFIVVRGILPFLILVKKGWGGKANCVLYPDIVDYKSMIFQDIAQSICSVASDPVGNAVKAAILRMDDVGDPILRNFELSKDMVGSSAEIDKKLTGFVKKSYGRTKMNIPDDVEEIITRTLKVKRVCAKSEVKVFEASSTSDADRVENAQDQ